MSSETTRYFCILTLGLLVACAGPEQTRDLPDNVSDAEAPQKATTVTVQASTSPQEAYRTAARVLQSEGYALENTDSELRSITTGRKSADPNGILVGLPEHRVTVSVGSSPTAVELRGTAYQDAGQSQIKKWGQSSSPQRLAWAQLVTIGHLVAEKTGGELQYEK